MISFEKAKELVLEHIQSYGDETVALNKALGRILAETIVADRDFPPFDRATKDGIAINFETFAQNEPLPIEGIAQAGNPQLELKNPKACIEVMTGAIVPQNADTVVMYEHTVRENDSFKITKPIKKGQDIHYQASDMAKGAVLLTPGTKITASEIGILASVGKAIVQVKKLPKVAVISTGDELVGVDQNPMPYQIRKSNSHTLQSLLEDGKIDADLFHLHDELPVIKNKLEELLHKYEVLLLSGGVSKGKYDYLPEAFDQLGIEKVFHRVLQRPGKPFWFGKHQPSKTSVFSFPGNPVSTFVNYHLYFKPWLTLSLGREPREFTVILSDSFSNTTDLTLFVGVKITFEGGKLMAKMISTTGSGDLTGLSKVDGFVQIAPEQEVQPQQTVPFIPTRNVIA